MAEFMTTEQAAKKLGVSARWIRRLCQEGRLGTRIGRNFALTTEDLRRYRKIIRNRP